MTKYREIIRLTGLGFSQRNIMASCGVSQKTVVKVQKRARELNISSVHPADHYSSDVCAHHSRVQLYADKSQYPCLYWVLRNDELECQNPCGFQFFLNNR